MKALQLGMTPARFAKGGKGEQIAWGLRPFPFWLGDRWFNRPRPLLAGLSPATKAEAEATLREEFPLRHPQARSRHWQRWSDAALQTFSGPNKLITEDWPHRRCWICGGRRFN